MYSQFQWMANQYAAGTGNIAFVTGLGDIVNTSTSTAQYGVADTAYDYLDAVDVPYSVSPGNHDLGGLLIPILVPVALKGTGTTRGL